MNGSWVTWKVNEDRSELVGPCGCRLPNTFDGLMLARQHECDGDK